MKLPGWKGPKRDRCRDADLFEQAWRSAAANAALDRSAMAAVRRDLERKTSEWAKTGAGLQLLREELLDGVDRALVHDAILALDADTRILVRRQLAGLPKTETEIRRLREADCLRRSVLRCWASLFYNDCRPGDWFETYESAAKLRRASVARNLQRLAGGSFDRAQNHRDAAVHALNTSLRLRLLKLPPLATIGREGSPGRLRRLLRRSYHKKFDSRRSSS